MDHYISIKIAHINWKYQKIPITLKEQLDDGNIIKTAKENNNIAVYDTEKTYHNSEL